MVDISSQRIHVDVAAAAATTAESDKKFDVNSNAINQYFVVEAPLSFLLVLPSRRPECCRGSRLHIHGRQRRFTQGTYIGTPTTVAADLLSQTAAADHWSASDAQTEEQN